MRNFSFGHLGQTLVPFLSFTWRFTHMNHSPPPPPKKTPFGVEIVDFFFTPLKHQDKLVNKADSIYSYLLYTWVKNTAVEE